MWRLVPVIGRPGCVPLTRHKGGFATAYSAYREAPAKIGRRQR
jgi:hypothetical protein